MAPARAIRRDEERGKRGVKGKEEEVVVVVVRG